MSVTISTKLNRLTNEVTATKHSAYGEPQSKTFSVPSDFGEASAHRYGLERFYVSETLRDSGYSSVEDHTWHLGCLDYNTMVWVSQSETDIKYARRIDPGSKWCDNPHWPDKD